LKNVQYVFACGAVVFASALVSAQGQPDTRVAEQVYKNIKALEVKDGVIGFLGSYAAFIASGEMAAAYFLAQFPYAVPPIHPAPGILAESAAFNSFFFLYIASRGSGILSVDDILRRRRSLEAPCVPA
jgi:hypothetical protein